MRKTDLVVIGGSAGAVEPLKHLAARLPPDFQLPILVTVHVPADFPSVLPQILSGAGSLPATHPSNHEPLRPGTIYVAPPDYHLLVEGDNVTLSHGPRENRHRPSVDVLFRSAARTHGSKVLGIILSGELDDGSAGLMAIRMRGGLCAVQDPAEALSPDMPSRAIEYAGADYILPIAEITNLLIRIGRADESQPPCSPREVTMQDHIDKEVREAKMENIPAEHQPGTPSEFACPECHGVLWEVDENGLLRFRCRVGHAFTADALRLAMSEAGENALWAAMRALEEKVALLRRMSNRSEGRLANHYREDAEANDKHVETIRRILIENQKPPKAEPKAA